MEMKRLGHPSFAKVEEHAVQVRAAQLPEDGIPPEVLRIIQEDLGKDGEPMDSKLMPQKAATPCEAPELDLATAGATFAAQRPRSVVAEGHEHREAHAAETLALENMVAELKSDGIRSNLATYEVRAGNQLVDMFRPSYWAIAFCFLFKHATAEPDVVNTVKAKQEGMEPSRRKKGNPKAPEVGIQAWAAAMQRQAASQFRRDWNFSPALQNYLFRTNINQEPNAYMFTTCDAEGRNRRAMTNKEIEAGVQEVYRKVRDGVYLDTNNEQKAVNGDLTKLRYVPGLSEAAHKVLNNLEARTRNVPGTHAVRTTMWHQTHGYRVKYGLSVFITFSPSEKDSALMLRMARARQTDPAIEGDASKPFYARNKPELDVDFCRLSLDRLAEAQLGRKKSCAQTPAIPRIPNCCQLVGKTLLKAEVCEIILTSLFCHLLVESAAAPCQELPDYEARRALLARDPLACAYGFRTLVVLALRHIFGVRFCFNCPDCATSKTPCTDAFGSNSTATGGVFGRIDAVYGSLECQRCGAFHMHGQFFVQCFHQLRSLSELVELGKEPVLELLRKYSDYSAHVSRKVYCNPEAWHDKQHEIEEQWPDTRRPR